MIDENIKGKVIVLEGEPERSVFAARMPDGEVILKFLNGGQNTLLKLSPEAAAALVQLLVLEGIAVRIDI